MLRLVTGLVLGVIATIAAILLLDFPYRETPESRADVPAVNDDSVSAERNTNANRSVEAAAEDIEEESTATPAGSISGKEQVASQVPFIDTPSTQLSADETFGIHDAIRIVVVTDDEGIHYERGCVFYELRELLAANEDNVSEAMNLTDDPLFEVRALGKSGNSTVYVGDHWMSTSAGTALLPTKAYERITELVQMRKGEGVPKSNIDASIRRASKRIQDPIYVEENRCAKQY